MVTGIRFRTMFILFLVLPALSLAMSNTPQNMPGLQENLADSKTYLPILVRQSFGDSLGILDPSFGTDGIVLTDFLERDDYGSASALQTDGKLVAAGSAYNGSNSDFAMARYNLDGSPDTSFNTDGHLVTDFAGTDDWINDIAIQADGKILAAGDVAVGSLFDFAIARYNTNGSLDTSFGTNGKVTTDFGSGTKHYEDHAYGIAIQPDEKIIVVGYSHTYYDFSIARYNPNGSLDTSFSEDGKLTDVFYGQNASGRAEAVVVQPDGRILVAGYAYGGSSTDFVVARFTEVGGIDSSFNGIGYRMTDFFNGADYAYSLALQPDGKIILAGTAGHGTNGDFAAARYNSDGSPDITFDEDGRVNTDFSGTLDIAYSAAWQENGKLILAGFTYPGSHEAFALARYDVEGKLDPSFGAGGKLVTDINQVHHWAESVVIQADGKIIASGSASNGTNYDLAVVRFK